MSFWNIFDIFAVSSKGETMTKVSDDMYVSSTGVSYTTMDDVTVGSDGSTFVQMGNHSSDGSVRLNRNSATGRGAVFNHQDDEASGRSTRSSLVGLGSDNDPW